jgi:cyanophycinase-like exopeptidase
MSQHLIMSVLAVLCLAFGQSFAQNYTSYYTGSPFDSHAQPLGGVCMMGGATEHDEAMRWFLTQANGGDILVLRASGSNGYNDYMYSELGVDVNSVESIVCLNANSANEAYIHGKIAHAEGIWFAGGDQWNYVSYWRNTAIDSLVNRAFQDRRIVIGGTSAGMAILGGFYFSAQNGTVSSAEALANPYDNRVTVDSTHFLDISFMDRVVTDTHYDNPLRKGRHAVFMARILTDYGIEPLGIACNEYTAVCVDPDGLARVYGDYPNYLEAAYFLQTNCEVENFAPEACASGQPLEWNLDSSAVRVCKVWGTNDGTNTFDLADWETDNGGIWENWFVSNGALSERPGVRVNCDTVFSNASEPQRPAQLELAGAYPNPFNPVTSVRFEMKRSAPAKLLVYDIQGREVARLLDGRVNAGQHEVQWNASAQSSGIYLIALQSEGRNETVKALLVK